MTLNVSESGASNVLANSSSWTYTDDEPVKKYDHVWSIVNFDRKMGMENGRYIQSGNFRISFKGKPTDWNLLMFPNGESEEAEGCVSLYLKKANVTPEPVEVEAIFYIVNQNGEKIGRGLKYQYTFRSKGEDHGYPQFKKHRYISLPSNKTFTILCEMSLLGDMVVSSGRNKWKTKLLTNEHSSTIHSPLDLSSFVKSGDFSDCIVKCGFQEFNCHKIILAGRSTVFKAMFSYNLKEKRSSTVVIEDFEENTVIELIHYIYSGQVRNLNNQAIKLISAADKYDLKELKATCESYLRDKISKANVWDIMIVAYLHNSKMLENAAFQFVSENGHEMLDQDFEDKLKLFPDILIRMLKMGMKK